MLCQLFEDECIEIEDTLEHFLIDIKESVLELRANQMPIGAVEPKVIKRFIENREKLIAEQLSIIKNVNFLFQP